MNADILLAVSSHGEKGQPEIHLCLQAIGTHLLKKIHVEFHLEMDDSDNGIDNDEQIEFEVESLN